MRPFSEGEKHCSNDGSRGYDTFITRCAEGRHTTKEAIEKIAEGRVWTGEAAKELGLVDELGESIKHWILLLPKPESEDTPLCLIRRKRRIVFSA